VWADRWGHIQEEKFSQKVPISATQHSHHGGQLMSSRVIHAPINLSFTSVLTKIAIGHVWRCSLDTSHTLAGCRQVVSMGTTLCHFSLLCHSACHWHSSGHSLQCDTVRFWWGVPGPIGCPVAIFIVVFVAVDANELPGERKECSSYRGLCRTSFWHRFKSLIIVISVEAHIEHIFMTEYVHITTKRHSPLTSAHAQPPAQGCSSIA